MEAKANPSGWPTWLWLGMVVLAAMFAAYTLAGSFAALAHAPDALQVFRISCGFAIAGFGALVLTRSRRDRAAASLGTILLAEATLVSPDLQPLEAVAGPAVAAVTILLVIVRGAFIGYFWPLFCLEISGGPASRMQDRLVHGLAAAFALMPAAAMSAGLLAGNASLSAAIWIVTVAGNQLLGYWILVGNYRRNDAAGRNRIKIVLSAFVFFMLAGLTAVPVQVFGLMQALPLMPAFVLAGAALLAYAVVRRQLFDFNFALNRTLVYATVSFVLLAAFGLAKWVIEHLIPESWHAGSEYYSVGIALGLFLILHRVHNSVERNVERYLFSPWHRNEEALRRFVTAAGHFDETSALCHAFTEEASRFAKSAGTALYLRRADGSYSQGCGSLVDAPPELAGDDLALALMRAERRPVRTTETRTALPGVLALPMLDHGKLAGFALLDRKGDGSDYRPDEVGVLGWATHQVGLDLQAMHASELEAEVAGLNARIAALEERDRLGAVLADLTGQAQVRTGGTAA